MTSSTPYSSPHSGVRRNATLNAIGFTIPIVVSVVSIPLYLDQIGETRFGVMALIWILLGYFGAFDLGLGRAATIEVSKLRHEAGRARAGVVWTALSVNAVVGCLAGTALLLIGYALFERILRAPPALAEETLSALPWVAAAVPFVTLSSVLVGALEGLERFGAVNAIEVTASVIYQLAPLSVAYAYGPDLRWLVVAAAIGPMAKTILAGLACWRHVPLGRPCFARDRASTLFRYGGWITVTAVLGPVLTTVDRFVLGAVAGAHAVTRYVVPMNLVSRLSILSYSVCRSLFPRLSFIRAEHARDLSRDSFLVLTAVLTPVTVLATLAMEPFLRVWVGASIAEASAPIGVILLVGVWCNGLALIPFTLIQGQGRPDVTAKFHLLEVVPYLAVLALGVTLAGARGLAAAWSLRMAADGLLLLTASSIKWRTLVRIVPASLVVVASLVAGLTAYDDAMLRIGLGGILALLALAAAIACIPRSLMKSFRRPSPQDVRRSPIATETVKRDASPVSG